MDKNVLAHKILTERVCACGREVIWHELGTPPLTLDIYIHKIHSLSFRETRFNEASPHSNGLKKKKDDKILGRGFVIPT